MALDTHPYVASVKKACSRNSNSDLVVGFIPHALNAVESLNCYSQSSLDIFFFSSHIY